MPPESPLFDHLSQLSTSPAHIFCLGVDPKPDIFPHGTEKFSAKTHDFIQATFAEMKQRNVIPGAIKLNAGYFLALDRPLYNEFLGSRLLQGIKSMAESEFPQSILILDFKTADIDRSSGALAEYLFHGWLAPAVTIHPYMGRDSMAPYFPVGNGYILTRTSNQGAKDLQDIRDGDGYPVYLKTAGLVLKLAQEFPGKVGAVVGATYPNELSHILQLWGNVSIPLLIPGIGSQGGDLQKLLSILKHESPQPFLHRINNGSAIWKAWKDDPQNPHQAVVSAMEKFTEELQVVWDQV